MAVRNGVPSRSRRRVNSSPSPPGDQRHASKARLERSLRRRSALGQPNPQDNPQLATSPSADWSTSYQASESSSHNDATSDDETEDDWDRIPRGRAYSNSTVRRGRLGSAVRQSAVRPSKTGSGSNTNPPSGSGASGSDSPAPQPLAHRRRTFTRSRSPAIPALISGGINEAQSQTTLSAILARHQTSKVSHVLPARFTVAWRVPLLGLVYSFSMDAKIAAECFLLVLSLSGTISRLSSVSHQPEDIWVYRELTVLMSISVGYLVWMNSRFGMPSPPRDETAKIEPQNAEARDTPLRRGGAAAAPASSATNKDAFGFVWMTVPKNYRESTDDGISTMLILAPMLAGAMLYSALQLTDATARSSHQAALLPPTWLIEPPATAFGGASPLESLVVARRNLVDLATTCAVILLVHALASHYHERRYRWSKMPDAPEGEVASVPRREAGRMRRYLLFSFCVAVGMLSAKALFAHLEWGFWQSMSYVEIVVASIFYQCTMYSAVRLAHRGFTLGEVALTSFGATVLFFELVSLTRAKYWPESTPYIRSYRLPTPLLIFQIALIPGALLNGFVLSPLLVLSRRLAQMPVRRLRYPGQKLARQRTLALGFYGGAAVVCGGLLGFWTRWMLGGRDPWMWAVRYILQGRRPWSRPALLAYWALLGSLSVAGWSRQLARSRRYRPRQGNTSETGVTAAASKATDAPPSTDASVGGSPDPSVPASPSPMGISFGSLPALPNGAGMSQAATDFLDAADRRVPTLSLNARRKFFHALAVAMFLPGIAFDPAFTHLSFSAAFALFTFAEYVRYFALYPFGATVHVFLSEFLDAKDAGTAILSHFYLLTGCAGSVWLEAPSLLLQFTGILTLGVGDALASIVGKRIGRHHWSPTTSKSLEGSAAFVLSVVTGAWLLRLCGLTESFSIFRYAVIVTLAASVEALSVQNDNLTIPWFMWSVLRVALV